ncbi:hypothetical protein K2173_008524 [Erythroxylum novogranatense]|uniref:Transmembrane protein n=1 Tax=Erythroxylum novogranatense TaxID=1862640 RepID=A0AAV8SLC7_9ROSI|nr:hypothetical protein K2173_008524 [Erythroxylum novogranatense]
MMLHFFQEYKNLLLQASLAVSLTLFVVFLQIPSLVLGGLHTYIHPDSYGQQNGAKAAIKRPSSSNSGSGIEGYQYLSSKSGLDVKKRSKSKEKFEFDESNAQIFRLKLDEGHLQSRIYFSDYRYSFICSLVALSGLLLSKYLGVVEHSGVLANGTLIPVILGFASLGKVLVSLARTFLEKSASKRSERQLSAVAGVLGFGFGLMICSGIGNSIFDFDLVSVDAFGRVCVALLMGCLALFLYIPAAKSARSFWLGTDQIRSNLEIISCGWFGRIMLYANFVLVFFTALLWINPLAELLVNKNTDHTRVTEMDGTFGSAKLVGNVGFAPLEFIRLRHWLLLISGLLQILTLRANLQMYLNEAVLSWYQHLHASKVPDLDFSRAKVFLHNHCLCLVALQFFALPILVLLFLGLSQIDDNSFGKSLACIAVLKGIALFMAWWIAFIWAVFTSTNLFLYRRGILYVS